MDWEGLKGLHHDDEGTEDGTLTEWRRTLGPGDTEALAEVYDWVLQGVPYVNFNTGSPIEVRVTAPDGTYISAQTNTMANAQYIRFDDLDFNGDGDPDDAVTVDDPMDGFYTVEVIPRAGALPDDVYSIVVMSEGDPVPVAVDTRIEEIPAQGHTVLYSAGHPSAVIADAGEDKLIAGGDSVVLAGSSIGGTPPYTYSWLPETGLSDPTAPEPLASPTGTTSYELTVEDSLGLTDIDEVTVEVAPALAASAGPDKLIALGRSTTLSGSASGGVPPYSYYWSPATGLDDPNVAQPTASPSSTTGYMLTVTDDLGQIAMSVVTVVVAPPVVADAGSDKTIGSGGSTTLLGSAAGGVPPYTYSWSPSTGLSSTTVAQPTASPTTTTVYTLTVTDDLGQTDTDTVTVTVASAVLANAGPDKTIASGGSTTLEGAASGGEPPYSYSWSPSTGLSSTTVAQPSASPGSTTVYTLTVTDDLGQTDTDTVTVTVASEVVANAGPDKTIAAGGSTTLQGSASGGEPPYTYSWTPATGLSSTTIAQPTASPGSMTVYTLTVTDDLGQTDTDSVTVTVVTGVLATAGPDKVIGSGGATTLEGAASGGEPPYSYSWSPSTGLSSTTVAQPTAPRRAPPSIP